MYDRILVPLDGSDLSEQVLDFVRIVAPAIKARVELLHVVSPSPILLVDPLDQIDARESDELRDHANQYLERVSASLRVDDIDVTHKVVVGRVAATIVDEAEGVPATMIAMSTHGRSGITRWLMGSVTDKVVQTATTPVLVFRARTESSTSDFRLRSILVPLDGSDLAEEVLPSATFLARALDLEVVLVMVTPASAWVAQWGGVPPEIDFMFEDVSKRSIQYLEGVQQDLSRQGLLSISIHTTMGRAARVIVDTAAGMSDNIVAMTTHGRSGLGRWVLGSVTDQVVRHCGDPVFVLRPGGADKRA